MSRTSTGVCFDIQGCDTLVVRRDSVTRVRRERADSYADVSREKSEDVLDLRLRVNRWLMGWLVVLYRLKPVLQRSPQDKGCAPTASTG